MDSFREDIKDSFIVEIGINPIAYDEKRGVDRLKSKSNKKKYIYDKADGIITQAVHKYLRKSRQLYRIFFCLYHCKTLQQAQIYLSLYVQKNVNGLLPIGTVQTYMKRAKEEMRKAFTKDVTMKEEIYRAIREEYEK